METLLRTCGTAARCRRRAGGNRSRLRSVTAVSRTYSRRTALVSNAGGSGGVRALVQPVERIGGRTGRRPPDRDDAGGLDLLDQVERLVDGLPVAVAHLVEHLAELGLRLQL